MVRHVVNIGGRSEQLGAIIEIHAKDERTGFGGAISRDTRQEFSMDLECREPVRCALSTPGKAIPIFRSVSKSMVLPGIGQSDRLELTVLLWLGIGNAYASAV